MLTNAQDGQRALQSFFGSGSTDALAGRPVAVVIETQETPNLVPLMLHFSTVLGPRWTVLLYTLEATWTAPDSPAFHRAQEAGHLDVRYLPADTAFTNSASVSSFLASPWLWEQLERAQHVLLWQTDSVICAKAPRAVDEFLGYDFVGAPIDGRYGEGYNGGLSLRNPRTFLGVTRTASFEGSGDEFEDQWFYKELKARAGDGGGVVLPSADVAMKFSVETMYYDSPIGYHQPARWQKDHMQEIEERCPEVGMLLGRRAK